MTRLVTEPISLDGILAGTATPEAGALAIFCGTVRNHNESRPVRKLSYSAYKPLAEKTLADIEQEACDRFDILGCRIVHRLGELEIGDTSVLIVVRSVHRAEAYDASRYAIEEIKHRAPIWKLEEYTDGTWSYVKGCSLHERHHLET